MSGTESDSGPVVNQEAGDFGPPNAKQGTIKDGPPSMVTLIASDMRARDCVHVVATNPNDPGLRVNLGIANSV